MSIVFPSTKESCPKFTLSLKTSAPNSSYISSDKSDVESHISLIFAIKKPPFDEIYYIIPKIFILVKY